MHYDVSQILTEDTHWFRDAVYDACN